MDVMMMLGPYLFSVNTAAYQDLKRNSSYEWTEQESIAKEKNQTGKVILRYKGLGKETISLSGTIYPLYYKAGILQLPLMRAAASQGTPLPLVGLGGMVLGKWIIESVGESQSSFVSYGIPKKIDFSLELRRYME